MARKKRYDWKTLRAAHWYELVRLETKKSNTQLNCDPEYRANTNRAAKWEGRREFASDKSVDRFRDVAPFTSLFYDVAPYELLNDASLSVDAIDSLVMTGEQIVTALADNVPKTFGVGEDGDVACWRRIADSNALVRRGDFPAFLSILALVRKAEAEDDDRAHIDHLSNLYRCLPALGRYRWLRRDFGLLCELVERIHNRVAVSAAYVGVDWAIIDSQFHDPEFEPDPERRLIDPETGCAIDISDPVRLAKVLSIGSRHEWPHKSSEEELRRKGHRDIYREFSYGQICRMHTDQQLLMSFMQTCNMWFIPRTDWEAILGVSSSELLSWMNFGVLRLSPCAYHRILTINALREWLSLDSAYRENREEAIDMPREDAGGLSIRALLRAGRTMESLELIRTPSHNSVDGQLNTKRPILPLVSLPM